MLTDLHLQKYLEGRLPAKEAGNLEALLEKNPELRRRLEALENRSQIVGRPVWQRLFLTDRHRLTRRSKWFYLPIALLILLIFSLAGHWFSRPGSNSTFTYQGGNADALELLYDAEHGWRFLDAGFRPGDSLTFSIRDGGRYFVAVHAVYRDGQSLSAVPVWVSDKAYSPREEIPAFMLPGGDSGPGTGDTPAYFVVIYHTASLPLAAREDIASLVREEGRGPDYFFQVFSLSPEA